MVGNFDPTRNFFVNKLILVFSQLLETYFFFATVAIDLIIKDSNPLFMLGLLLISVINKEVLQPSTSFFFLRSFILFRFLFMPVQIVFDLVVQIGFVAHLFDAFVFDHWLVKC